MDISKFPSNDVSTVPFDSPQGTPCPDLDTDLDTDPCPERALSLALSVVEGVVEGSRNINTNLYDAFISYGRADSKAFAAKLQERLHNNGFKVWFDFNDIPLGVDYQNQIDDGITKADNFLFLISPHSINSPYCRKEIELAIKLKKRIIPLLHVGEISQETWQQRHPSKSESEWESYQKQGLHSSFPNMPPMISKINWIYVQEEIDDFEKGFSGLIDIFHRHQDYVHQHTFFLNRAIEWEQQQKQTRYLLIGEEREAGEAWLKYRFQEEQPPCEPTLLHCELVCESIKNANNLMTQVFISYSDVDIARMHQIREILLREGITIWTNKTDIKTGEVFEEAINRGIEQADNIVYLISSDALTSYYCQQEINYALSLNKRIIPLLIRTTDLAEIPPIIRGLQFIDFTDNQTEVDLRRDLDDLLKVLREEESYYEEHKMLLSKAIKWEQQHRNPIILLQGYNLRHAEVWLKRAEQKTQYQPTPLQQEFIRESLRQPPAASLDVFISYSRSDSDLARSLNDELHMRGKTTWFDQESIASGADFQKEIYLGIESADNFLFILSPRSINSPYCADEVEYAAKLNKRFITILHQEINTADLHPALAKIQWIDFRQRVGDFYDHLNQLIRTLDTDREYIHSHTKWLRRAIEWESENHNSDLLLHGSEFAIADDWFKQANQGKKQPYVTELQTKFINSSRNGINAVAKQEKQRVVMLRSLLGVMTVVAIVAIGATIDALQERKKANINLIKAQGQESLSLLNNGQIFDALISAITVGNSLKKEEKNDPAVIEPYSIVTKVLQKSIFDVTEHNRLVKHSDYVRSVSFSPDGNTLASGSKDNTIKLWDVRTGKELLTFSGHNNQVWSVSFSPDGKTLASGSEDKTIKLWDVRTGKELLTLSGHRAKVESVSFSPDGNILATSSKDETIKLWDVRTGKELRTLSGHSNGVWSVSFSSDGKTLASGSEDKTIKLWDVSTGQELRTLSGHSAAVGSVSFSSDGKTLASGSDDKTIKLWDVRTGKELLILSGHDNPVNSVNFSPDGKTLASGSGDKTIKLWDVGTGQELLTLSGHNNRVWSVNFSPDGKTLASGSLDDTIKLWDVRIGKELPTLFGHNDVVWSVSFSPDGKTLASGSLDKTIKLWDVRTKKELLTLSGHSNPVYSISFSPDGKTLASGSGDKTIKLWDVKTGKELLTLPGHGNGIMSINFSPDGKTLVSGSLDKTIKLWDVRTGKELSTLSGHRAEVLSVSFNPEGTILASGSVDKTIKLWDVRTGKELLTLSGHNNPVNSISFSPDGKTLATSSFGGIIKLWDVRIGKEIRTLSGHDDTAGSVSFSPDGKILATGSLDKTIKLWNTSTGKELITFSGHYDKVNSVSFSPDGKTLASGSSDTTIILWNLDFDLNHLLEMGCNWLYPYLHNPDSDASERDRHLCDDIGTGKNHTK